MKSSEELENVLSFEGKDIVLFVYSSEMENEFQQNVVKNFQRLAAFFMEKDIESIRFISYDLNLNGPNKKIKLDVPAMYMSPAFKRNQELKYYMGDPKVEDMAQYIKKHADIKFKANVKNLDQNMQI